MQHCVSEIVGYLADPIKQLLADPIKQHLGYLFSSPDNVRKMTATMEQLDGTSIDVMNHKDRNDINALEVPARVPSWLEKVATIKRQVESISSNDYERFNMIVRYQVGRDALKTTLEIESLLEEGREIHWSDALKPLARVNTNRASASAPSRGGDDFKSRDMIFKDALMFLQDHKTQVIALCGMGGVGKTTMMEQLKMVGKDKKMFDWIVKVVLGKQPKTVSIQQAVAENLGLSLTETIEETRAERLHEIIEKILEKDKKGILVILDDVWGKFELKNVGLSPLPNGVKLLLTSRYEDICRCFAVEAGNLHLKVLKVDVLEETEAHKFFCQITEVSVDHDPELYQIRGEIVKKCSYLPLAIKLIASTLKWESKSAIWRDRLRRLKKNGPDPKVHEIIEISYDYQKEEEDKEIFLLCGLFPEDSDIPIEDLTRYAWGLQLLDGVSTLEDARDRTEACVSHLKNAHLLIDNDDPRYVKLHDLVLDFVVATVSKGDHASLIKHGDVSTWSSVEMSESYRRISLSCKGLPEFPKGFKSPNLSLLKLMNGDDSFWFPEDFYGNTEKLEVIECEKVWNPLLLPRLLQCSTNLRTLCIHYSSLEFDFSSIGNLVNLEVLSFSHSTLRELPSSIGNLKKLKFLDLTRCFGVKINDGVLENLVKLEELYMRDIEFTERNSNELAGRSKNLLALEIKCFENKGQLKNMSYENLKRFKIYMGNFNRIWTEDLKLFGNKLYLVTNKDELLESGMNGLLEKTEELCLEVDGMTNLEDIEVKSLHSPQYSSFCNLRSLMISKCAELRYIFTLRVATALSKLEHLDIYSCKSMQELIHIESSESKTIKFPKLKFLSLYKLPNLLSLCNTIIEIKLPQLMDLQLDGLPKFTSIYPKKKLATSSMVINDSAWRPFLNEEVVVPKLEKLLIHNMENLKEIWPCEYSSSKDVDVCILREIDVNGCDSLVNLFPSNPMTLLHHLEDLKVENCSSIEALFNIDLGCVGEIEEVSCRLRSIQVTNLGKLREVWRIKGANNTHLHISAFQAVESIKIDRCTMLKSSQHQELRKDKKIPIHDHLQFSQEDITSWSLCQYSREINLWSCDALSSVVPFNAIGQMQKLEKLTIDACDSLVEVFETTNFDEGSDTTLAIPRPKNINVPQLSNLKELDIDGCNLLQHVFTFATLESLSQLHKLKIEGCEAMKMIVKEESHEEQTTISKVVVFPRLKSIALVNLPTLTGFFLGMNDFQWPLLDEVKIDACPQMTVFTRGCSEAPKLNNIYTKLGKHSLECGLNFHVMPNLQQTPCSSLDGTGSHPTTSEGIIRWSFNNLIEMDVKLHFYDGEHIIPSKELLQVQTLERIHVKGCHYVKEVFEALEDGGFSEWPLVVKIPKLREVELGYLVRLKYIWKSNPWMVLEFPNLTKVTISYCGSLEHVFSSSMVGSLLQLQELIIMECASMEVIVEEENVVVQEGDDAKVNNEIIMLPRLKSLQLIGLPRLEGFYLGKEAFSWPSLETLEINRCPAIRVFTNGHLKTPELKVIDTSFGRCELDQLNSFIKNKQEEGLFEALEDSGLSELPFVVKIPKLREVELKRLDSLKYIWKSNPWMVLEFPNLTKVTISYCRSLEHVFSSSMVGSLLQLQDLHISECWSMEVIVKESNVVEEEEEEGDDAKVNNEIIMLPRLKSLQLEDLESLKGFYLGKETFSWPSLDTLKIEGCPAIRVLTKGHSATPQLKVIHTKFGRCEVREDQLNSFIKNKQEEGLFK